MQTTHETTVEEKDKTEYEKMKIKLDKWLKTVTAAQLLKAKELSLKELGEEDKLQSQYPGSTFSNDVFCCNICRL
jgi:hypothetical protein